MKEIRRLAFIGCLFAVALFAIVASADSVSAAPSGRLFCEGQRHEYLTQGKAWNASNGTWYSNTFDNNRDGNPDGVDVGVDDLPLSEGNWWFFRILGPFSHLTPGTYEVDNSVGAGTVYFHMSTDHRGTGVDGTFTVHEIATVPEENGLRLVRFSVSWDMTTGSAFGPRWLRGSLDFRDDGSTGNTSFPYITKAKYLRAKHMVRINGRDFQRGATVTIGGQEVTVEKVTERVIKTKDVTLAPGIHRVVVTNPDGGDSVPYEIVVFTSVQPDQAGELNDDEDEEAESDE